MFDSITADLSRWYRRRGKRGFDLVATVLTAPFWLPVLAVVATAVRCVLGSPVLFRQERTGQHGKPFTLYKFRSMSSQRDGAGRPLPDEQRLGTFGRLLRSSSLDELPELWNVLVGQMSLVGPRPLLPRYLPRYSREERRRHDVRPGVTGLAQVSGRNASTWRDRFAHDVAYVDRVSIGMDLWILLRTVGCVFSSRGVSAAGHATMPEFTGIPRAADAPEAWPIEPAAHPPRENGLKPKRVFLSPPDAGPVDRQAVLDAFDSNWLAPLGPNVDAFEAEFADRVQAGEAVALSSGTAALHLALVVAGVRPGDHVLVPTFTFVATANAVRHAGAVPVFVDCDHATWTVDPELLATAAERLVAEGRPAKAVVPVDLFGQCADYDAIAAVCREFNMRLIADAAESLGASYRGRPAGGCAEVSCFSFNGNKIITTSGGGMLVTNNRQWAERARRIAAQARTPGVQYNHDEVGYNYRLSNLLAALGRTQLSTLDERVARRRAIFARYAEELAGLPGVSFMPEAAYGKASRWLTCIQVDPHEAGCSAEAIRLALEDENIESRPVWRPLHLQPAHASTVVKKSGEASTAERLWQNGLCLPSGSSLDRADQQRVVDTIRRHVSRRGIPSAA